MSQETIDFHDITHMMMARAGPEGRKRSSAFAQSAAHTQPTGQRMVIVGGADASPRSEDTMDGPSFDSLARLVRTANSRRTAVKAAFVPALAGLGATLFASPSVIDAKKKKKKCKKCKAKGLLEACTTNKDCCTNETNRLCAIPSNPSSAQTVCCGGIGASCGDTDDCCGDFVCDGNVCDG